MPRKRSDVFKPGDLVFAKMKGFPHWPARVCKSEDGYNKRVPVYFYGTHQIGLIPPNNIVPFAGNKNKYGSSGVRAKGFTEGMWEIQNTPGVGSKVRVPVKKTPSSKSTNDKLKPPPTKLSSGQSATAADGKSGSGRSTPSSVATETEAAAAKRPPASETESRPTAGDAEAPVSSRSSSTPAGRRTRQTTAKTEDEAEQHKQAPVSPAAASPAPKRQKITETRSASRPTSQNNGEKMDGRRKKAKKHVDLEERTREKKTVQRLVMKTRGAEKKEETRPQKEEEEEEEEKNEEETRPQKEEEKEEETHPQKEEEKKEGTHPQKEEEKKEEETRPQEKRKRGAPKKQKQASNGKKEEKPGERPASEGRKTRAMRRTKETTEDERDGPEEETRAEDQQRRRHLASNRESVLTSLRGLLKDGRRGRRPLKTSLKTSVRATKSLEVRKPPGQDGVRASTVGRKPGPKPGWKKLRSKVTTEAETDGGSVSVQVEADQQTRKSSNERDQSKDQAPKTADEASQHQDQEKKEERKIIGKIVKATAKQGSRVKTMMGGLKVPVVEEPREKIPEARADDTAAPARRSQGGPASRSQEKKKEEKASDKGQKKSERTAERGEKSAESKPKEEAKKDKAPTVTLTDSTLHRIHGDLRISLKSDNPDIGKCLKALDQLSMVYVTSQHVQRHSELVATLRKMRFYRANQAVMDKASMLYNRFKNAFLAGQGEEVVSAAFLRSLLQEREREEPAGGPHGPPDS